MESDKLKAITEFALIKPPHELVALGSLRDFMAKIEGQRRERIKSGADPAEVDRAAAQLALTGIAEFLKPLRLNPSLLFSYWVKSFRYRVGRKTVSHPFG